MAVYGKLGLLFDELRQFLQRTQHQIDDFSTTSTLNMVMMRPPMADFVAHLSFVETDGIHQAQLLKHRKVPVHRDEIGSRVRFDQACVHFGRRNGKSVPFKNRENRFSRFRQFLSARFEAADDGRRHWHHLCKLLAFTTQTSTVSTAGYESSR